MTLSTNIHGAERMEHRSIFSGTGNDTLSVETAHGHASIFCPPHVAEATAAAFNRAMQAAPYKDGGFTYTTDRQSWRIWLCPYSGWRGQSDEITGDGDPAWLFADGQSLFDVMDEIDALEKDNGCERCAALPGLDNLHEIGRGKDMEMICADCLSNEGKRQAEMQEMADDDCAHAMAAS